MMLPCLLIDNQLCCCYTNDPDKGMVVARESHPALVRFKDALSCVSYATDLLGLRKWLPRPVTLLGLPLIRRLLCY